jgi:hypothetical protein
MPQEKGYHEGEGQHPCNPKPLLHRRDVGGEECDVDELIAEWLVSKFAVIDRNAVPEPDREYDEKKSVHQEVDEHLESSLTTPGEQSLAYPLSGQFLRMMVEWTQIHTEQNDEIQED